MKTLRIATIMALERRAIKESQKAVDKIFSRYSKLINIEIAKQLPKGFKLNSWNGMCNLEDENGNEVAKGNWWSRYDNGNPKLEKLASLQYSTDKEEISGSVDIPMTIISSN